MSLRELIPPAIANNDEETLRSLMAADVDLNAHISGMTPLCHAARLGQFTIVKFLIESGVDINGMSGIQFNDWSHAKFSKLDNVNGGSLPVSKESLLYVTPLNAGAIFGHLATVMMLFSHDADLTKADSAKRTPLCNACRFGHDQIVKLLLPPTLDVNSPDIANKNTVINATIAGNIDIIRALIARKGDVNWKDKFGRTALHYALLREEMGIVSYLLESGCELVSDEEGMTPLSMATKTGNTDAMSALLAWRGKRQLMWRSDEGYTLMHLAAKYNKLKALQLLIKLGLEINKMSDSCKYVIHQSDNLPSYSSCGDSSGALGF